VLSLHHGKDNRIFSIAEVPVSASAPGHVATTTLLRGGGGNLDDEGGSLLVAADLQYCVPRVCTVLTGRVLLQRPDSCSVGLRGLIRFSLRLYFPLVELF
jgi:hypothetical protein